MINKAKELDIKNRTYYFFKDVINIKILHPNKNKIDEKSYKNIVFYLIGYVTIKVFSYATVITVISLCLVIDKINRYIEKSKGNNI